MSVKELVESLHPLERKVLPYISKCKSLKEIQGKSNLQEIEVSRALQWFENKGVLKIKKNNSELVQIGKNGKEYLSKGLPEKQFLKAIREKRLSLNEISEKTGLSRQEVNISLGFLKRKKAIIFGKEIEITAKGKELLKTKSPEEKFLESLPKEKELLNKDMLKDLLKRRELIEIVVKKDKLIEITALGKKLSKSKISDNFIESLTPAMIRDGSFEKKKFRKYDVEINVPKIYPGKRHFVNEAKNHAKKIWLSMGFKEMSGPVINSGFWNFDSLFVPQDHPAREMQDTFFLKGKSKLPSKKIVDAVKKQHEEGWKYKWDPEVAMKSVLRTHTTVLSARTIANLKEKDLPVKYFSIGRNYRNEALDWSHLFEFNQSEGIVIDPNANFKHLLGYLKEFFMKMGYDDVRFRPAYFPYTEPSVEIDVYVKEKDSWVELGGAGIFRPEVVKPLLGKDIPVLAWGFGLGRVILPYYGIKDLRDFYKNDLKQLKEMKSWI
ncbi:phenylalanine--tRNA ligase subunit alpha [Candidatus Woesearchaeota archaeon]|jgi:phenylalanyl-tRNA synthetase alpha chain|nr:phenylalanine--tRNA ligase subunit alpha [Candidatus Woesearchaeota archaeon]MBT7237336.1 phenylalanine--tRNA ligase subunit alpha [Candidatus Woesearchaeota archaeon]